jgi:hypothetical protein
VRAGEDGAGDIDIEPETRLRSCADPDDTEFVAVLVDPGAGDTELVGKRAGINESVGCVATGSHQVDHAPCDRLDRRGVEDGVRARVLGMDWLRWFWCGHHY